MTSNKSIKISEGYYETVMGSWGEFLNHVQDLTSYNELVWRGHQDPKWELTPTLHRLFRDSNSPSGEYFKFIDDHLKNFKYAVRGRRGTNPPIINTDNEWWSLGQHYGLATPLLDWTHSPFVAAFFAFHQEAEVPSGYRAIFVLQKSGVERIKIMKGIGDNEIISSNQLPNPAYIDFLKPMSDENHNLVNQNGLFTKSHVNIEQWIKFNVDSECRILEKFLIPNSNRHDCLKMLNRMNISHLTLFPDLYGAAKYCNLNKLVKNY